MGPTLLPCLPVPAGVAVSFPPGDYAAPGPSRVRIMCSIQLTGRSVLKCGGYGETNGAFCKTSRMPSSRDHRQRYLAYGASKLVMRDAEFLRPEVKRVVLTDVDTFPLSDGLGLIVGHGLEFRAF